MTLFADDFTTCIFGLGLTFAKPSSRVEKN